MISCKGMPVAFRLLQTDEKYQPASFPAALVDKLYTFTKSLDAWKPAVNQGVPVYYKTYLSFKIRGGHVVEVSP